MAAIAGDFPLTVWGFQSQRFWHAGSRFGRESSTWAFQSTKRVSDCKIHPSKLAGTDAGNRVENIGHETRRVFVCLHIRYHAVSGLEHSLRLLLDRQSLVVIHRIGMRAQGTDRLGRIIRQDGTRILRKLSFRI